MNIPVKLSAPGTFQPLLAVCLALLIPKQAHAADAAADPKTEKAAELLALFQSDSNITNSLGMVMVHLPQQFRVAQYEVTQADYQAVMGDNPSKFPGSRRPVEHVSWNSAKSFCERLTQKEREAELIPPGYSYALPTEAQWETYVDEARIQDSITSHLGDRRSTENVGGLPANEYGLHDTRGNVWEWCSTPVARGASFRSHEDYLEIKFRFVGEPSTQLDDIGFRIVLQPSAAR